jgi:phosphoglycolate phosphatase
MSVPARLAIFDLDGTLVDSLADIARAANAALAGHGLPTHPTAQFRDFVGWGVRRLIELAAPGLDEPTTARVEATFRQRYSEDLIVDTAPYPGIAELLDELAGAGVALAVLSNKPDPLTARVVAGVLGRHRWVAIRGHRPECPRKPDPRGLLEICDGAGFAATEAVMIGDTDVDIACARAAGARSIAVGWGFGRGLDGASAHAVDVAALRLALAELTGR